MNYVINGNLTAQKKATFTSSQISVKFAINSNQNHLPNPVELLLGAFAACCLKNIDRFSETLKFNYELVRIEVLGERQDKPTKIIKINYVIFIKSEDASLNIKLLHKNLKKIWYNLLYTKRDLFYLCRNKIHRLTFSYSLNVL